MAQKWPKIAQKWPKIAETAQKLAPAKKISPVSPTFCISAVYPQISFLSSCKSWSCFDRSHFCQLISIDCHTMSHQSDLLSFSDFWFSIFTFSFFHCCSMLSIPCNIHVEAKIARLYLRQQFLKSTDWYYQYTINNLYGQNLSWIKMETWRGR